MCKYTYAGTQLGEGPRGSRDLPFQQQNKSVLPIKKGRFPNIEKAWPQKFHWASPPGMALKWGVVGWSGSTTPGVAPGEGLRGQ